jgi:hypothetical protein
MQPALAVVVWYIPGMRTPVAPLLVSMLLVAGCGDDDSDSQRRSSTAARPASVAPASSRPLPAKWYVDSDDNGIPDFVERALGYDPRVDDCTQRRCPLPAGTTAAQAARGRSTVIALDASGSMAASAGGGITKMAAAKRAIRSYIRETPAALDRFGLVVFGHRGDNSAGGRAASCKGVETLAPVGSLRGAEISRVLARFKPTGWTPIAAALTEAGRSLRAAGSGAVARILLVTDGLETCGGRPVSAARKLQRTGVHVVVDVVGLDLDAAKARPLRAVAAATGGRYVDARTTGALLSRFEGFSRESRRLAAQLGCLGRSRDRATICQAHMRDVATIEMNSRADHLRIDGDAAGGKEVDRLVAALRARTDDEIASDRMALDRRAAEVQRQLDAIAEQAR